MSDTVVLNISLHAVGCLILGSLSLYSTDKGGILIHIGQRWGCVLSYPSDPTDPTDRSRLSYHPRGQYPAHEIQ